MHDQNIKDDRGYNQGWADTPSTRIRAERRAGYMLAQMEDKPGNSIMEIGCGTGDISYMMAKKSRMDVLGTDLCVPFIEHARKEFVLPNLSYDVLDFNKAGEFMGRKFNYITGNGILHHLYHHLDEALVNLRALLKPAGKIIFLEPNLYNPYIYFIFSYESLRKKAHLEPDEMAFSKPFIEKKLHKAGFKEIRVEFRDFLLPGIPEVLVKPSIVIGDAVEKIPLLRSVSQSLYIVASA
jgi:SAM-dependent methyltransferase